MIEKLKHKLGSDVTAASIRKAIRHAIECPRVNEIKEIHAHINSLLTVKDAAKLLRVDPSTVRLWLYSKKLKGYKRGNGWLVDLDSVLDKLKPNVRQLKDVSKMFVV